LKESERAFEFFFEKREETLSKESRRRTLLIMPSRPEKTVLALPLPRPICVIVIFLLGALFLIAGAGSWGLFQYYKLDLKTSQLEIENYKIKMTLKNQIKKNASLNNELIEIRKKAELIRGFLGLGEEENRNAKLGQGGLELSPENLPFSISTEMFKNLSPQSSRPLNSVQLEKLSNSLETIIELLNEKEEKLECTPSVTPVNQKETWISSGYGSRISPFTGKKQFHAGIDLAGRKGASIFSTAKGKVTFVGENGAMGLTVKVKHGASYQTMYGHLLEAAVKKGQSVARGDVIGYMGNSGRSTGYHVHYGVKKNGKHVNPYPYMMDWSETVFAAGRDD